MLPFARPERASSAGRLERAARDDDRPRADTQVPRVDTDRGAVLDEHPPRPGAERNAHGVRPRRSGRHLRSERAAEAARAADASLLAVAHVARLGGDVPAELAQPALEHRVAPGGPAVLLVHAEPRPHRVDATHDRVDVDSERAPLFENVRRRTQARRPVDRRAAAERRPISRSTDWSSVAVPAASR